MALSDSVVQSVGGGVAEGSGVADNSTHSGTPLAASAATRLPIKAPVANVLSTSRIENRSFPAVLADCAWARLTKLVGRTDARLMVSA